MSTKENSQVFLIQLNCKEEKTDQSQGKDEIIFFPNKLSLSDKTI